MVNPGHPSRGCQACKERKMRCDLTTPSCRRCMVGRGQCPGVPSETKWRFQRKQMTSSCFAAAPAKSTAGGIITGIETVPSNHGASRGKSPDVATSVWQQQTRSTSSSQSDLCPVQVKLQPSATPFLSSSDANVVDRHAKVSPPPRSLLVPLEAFALNYLFDEYVLSSAPYFYLRDPVHHLVDLFQNGIWKPSLYHATLALATATFANDLRSKNTLDPAPVEMHSLITYGRLLNQLQYDVSDPVKSTTDETLLSVILLTFFESATAWQHPSSLQRYRKHVRGALDLLLHRGRAQFAAPISLQLFRQVRNQVAFNSMNMGKPPTVLFSDPLFLDDAGIDDNPFNELAHLSVRLSCLRNECSRLLDLSSSPENTLESAGCAETAMELEASLQEWYERLPETFKLYAEQPTIIIGRPEVASVPSRLPRFDQFIAFVLNRYRAMRVYVHETTVRLHTWQYSHDSFYTPLSSSSSSPRIYSSSCSPATDERFTQALTTINHLTHTILYSMPHYLHALPDGARAPLPPEASTDLRRPWSLIWPLATVFEVEGVEPSLKGRVEDVLRYLAEIKGFDVEKVVRPRYAHLAGEAEGDE